MKNKIHTSAILFIVFALGQQSILARRPNPLATVSQGSSEGGEPSQTQWHTSPFAKACENLTKTQSWSDYGESKSPGQVWNYEHISKDIETGEPAPTESEDDKRMLRDIAHSYQICQAFLFATDPAGYSREESLDPTFTSMSAGAIGCLNQGTPEEQQQCMAASEEESSCRNNGYETHDFKACVSLLKFSDGFFIAKQGLQQVQVVTSQVNAIDSQNDVNAAINNGDDATVATLTAQKDSLSQQSNMAVQQGALDGAKAATLLAKISAFPTKPKLIEKCQAAFTADINEALQISVNNVLTQMSNPIEPVDFTSSFDAAAICASAIDASDHILMNQGILDQMKALAVQSAIESAANLAKGALLNNMAGKVDDTVKDIKAFEPPEFQEFDGVLPPLISECVVDPTIEGCPPVGSPSYQGFGGQGFSSSVGGAASLGNNTGLTLDDDDDLGSSVAAGGNDNVIPSRFGSSTGAFDNNNDFSEGKVAAGTIKSAGGAGGGSGGGGGGGGASPPGKAPQTGAQASNETSAPNSVAVKTSGSGLGAVGGRGRFGSKKPKSKNPFSKLLSKAKPKNGVLNFRGPAQIGKGGSIFKMISNRYSNVSAKKRLLQYKQK
jgi:hypothetical protein